MQPVQTKDILNSYSHEVNLSVTDTSDSCNMIVSIVSAIFFEKTNKGHCQSDQYRNVPF